MLRRDPQAALRLVQALGARGRILYYRHALERMAGRRVRRGDVRRAIESATECTFDRRNHSWRVRGLDLDGAALVVACRIDGLLVVKTVF